MSEICRFCLKTEDDTYNSLETEEYKNKILDLIPEMDINIVENPLTCSYCNDLLFTAHTFKLNCLRIEEQLKNYIKNGETKIKLDELLNKLNEKPEEPSCMVKFEVTEINSSHFDRGTREQLKQSVKDGESKIKIEGVLNKINEKPEERFVKFEVTEINSSQIDQGTRDQLKKSIKNREIKIKLEDVLNKFNEKPVELLPNVRIEVMEDETSNYVEQINIKEAVKEVREKDRKRISCKLCNILILKTSLRLHLRRHLKSKFACAMCIKGFNSKDDYITHNRETHNLTCKFCNRTFFNDGYYQKHMEDHEKFGKLQCEICGLNTSSFLLLQEHSRVHTGERPFQCKHCDKSFAQRSTLSMHVKTVHSSERPYMCEICGKSYAIRGAHTAHIKTHQEVVKNFVCKWCGKSFRIASELKEHENRHAGIRDRICEFCGKGFVDTSSLRVHLRKHNGDKRYECMICGKKFATNCIKKTHLRSCMRKHASLDSETSTKERSVLPT